MWTLVRDHLVVKIAIVVVTTLLLGFAIPAAINARLQLAEMERGGRDSAQSIAQGLIAGVRTAMLTGNGMTARTMVADARTRLSTSKVRIFAPNGEEVFGPPKPVPETAELPPHVASILGGGDAVAPGEGTDAIPIRNEARCQSCHPDGTLRGVLTLGTAKASVVLDGGDATLDVLNRVCESAFVQIMTAEKDDLLEAYFAELVTGVDGVAGVSVLDPSGDVAFGAQLELAEPISEATYGDGTPKTSSMGGDRLRILPLANDARCHACHDADDKWRGALVIRASAALTDPRASVVEATDVSLRHVMLSGLGRMIARFLDEVAATGAVSALTLHDGEGRLFRDAFARPDAPTEVSETLTNGEPHSSRHEADGAESFVFVAPMTNDPECAQCHGTEQDLRGAIEVTIDTSAFASSRKRLVMTGVAFAVGTIVATLVLLYFGMRALVVRPVAQMGTVADLVSDGKLDARVQVRSTDEIGRLGDRLNHMIVEIRKKLELSKFVSKATLGSVNAATSGVLRVGRRQRMTILFSDIRGFTAYSETVEPEAVVLVLNRYLDAQADVVEKHGGDIDKFVGDEVMAHFHGDEMEARAVACALDMLAAVERINRTLDPGTPMLQVGVGINAGEVVFGAMGAKSRMDFTVIGDAVNLGARLCSAAGPGQVLVSAAITTAAQGHVPATFTAMESILVKGKRALVEVFEVRTLRAPAPPRGRTLIADQE